MEYDDLQSVYRFILATRAVGSGTPAQKQSLRTYFLRRSATVSAQLTHRWCSTGAHIAKLIASTPWILSCFLEAGFGRAYLTSMFTTVMEHGQSDAFLNIIQYEPLGVRFAARRAGDPHYEFVWTHYVPQMFGSILDAYLRFDGIVIDGDVLLSILPSLSPRQLEIIITHPCHRNLVYDMRSPLSYAHDHGRAELAQYENAERLWKELRAARRAAHWRFMFWCAVLHSRMMEFRERYWAIGGARVQAAAAEFNGLRAVENGKN